MGYRGGRLASLAADDGATERTARGIADSGGRLMTEVAVERTPVESGEVRASWRQLPVDRERREGVTGYVSGASNHHWRARFVEWGVQPHNIEPRGDPEGAEAVETPAGPRALVHHPSYPGAHMTAQAAAAAEVALPELAAPELEAWAKDVELAAKRRPGVT
jgi:hypothetical protein